MPRARRGVPPGGSVAPGWRWAGLFREVDLEGVRLSTGVRRISRTPSSPAKGKPLPAMGRARAGSGEGSLPKTGDASRDLIRVRLPVRGFVQRVPAAVVLDGFLPQLLLNLLLLVRQRVCPLLLGG